MKHTMRLGTFFLAAAVLASRLTFGKCAPARADEVVGPREHFDVSAVKHE